MPNRKTFDEREKYDHSAHRPSGAEAGDLAPIPAEDGLPTQRETQNPGERIAAVAPAGD